MVTQQKPEEVAAKGAGLVLLTLASAQFLMTLDSSVMNVSIATVAKDVSARRLPGSRPLSRSTRL